LRRDYLADLARAVVLMPALLEAEHFDIEPNGTVHVSNEEHGKRVPPDRAIGIARAAEARLEGNQLVISPLTRSGPMARENLRARAPHPLDRLLER
jgi:hypothetical protein